MKKVALVLGKFMDAHVGHEALIKFAKSKAEDVIVLVCKGESDRVPVATRGEWLYDTFGNSVRLIEFDYIAAGLEGGEESDRGISKGWAECVDENFPEVDLLVGSEDYVRYMADYGSFDFEIFDPERVEFPCSSTAVNEGAFEFRIASAKRDLIKKIAFIGPESTGKTTAVTLAGEALGLPVVYEAARDIMGDSKDFTFMDLDNFALQQQLDINKAIASSKSNTLLIDSSAFSTACYSGAMFGDLSTIVDTLRSEEDMHHYIVFSPEVEFVQDGTRGMSIEAREEFFEATLLTLKHFNLPFSVVRGVDYEGRIDQVISIIKEVTC